MNTILFDLDGTLLPIDMDEFTKEYFYRLSQKLKDYIDHKELTNHIWASTKYMISNKDEDKTNMEAFFEDFQKRVNDIETLKPIIDEFYKKDFSEISKGVFPCDFVKDIVKILKDKNYKLVLATNPLFPQDAIFHRIKWAGLNKDDFILITTYEKMHFCKPNIEYYKEILSIIDKKSSEVMMVGNDAQEDMVVSNLGIKTYLIEDYIIDRKEPSYNIDYKGTLKDFYNFVKKLPYIKANENM